jgi:hypothetical protein
MLAVSLIAVLAGGVPGALPLAAAAPAGQDPTYDATGRWALQMSAPRLVSGECVTSDDEGFEETATVRQEGGRFRIGIGEAPVEDGTVAGAAYRHGSTQAAIDPSGLPFQVTARSEFHLESADRARGETVLELDYADGAHCRFVLTFVGRRLP